ncbi:DHA2 family efflux MFS transporter permease subunit [Legionella gresilensis]|uniref:DHA2 family efflux MFS transporter permease subunit n=1 Tax=Legionella gresilensis TaxID=91823 RepID=UPI0010417E03|nr:DHA2 family efflux MFS transporter permease subunit [Legionella gresilensis]
MQNSNTVSYPPLEGGKLVIATIAVALATFMIVLDSSIANVAIPTIAGSLGVSIDEGTWVITLFAAANAVSIPLTGWLTQRLGQVKLFIIAIALFVFASFCCGIATNLTMLLAARVLQGLAAGPLIPLSQAILLSSYPKEKSSIALALWGMTATVGPIAGPALGGWITDSYSWSWIFYINLPIGFFAGIVTWIMYRKRETPTLQLPVDKIGLFLLILWVGAFQIMLDKGKDLDWFNSTTIILLGLITIISFGYFLIWELTIKNPIVDLRLFKRRNFTGGTIAISVAYGVFFGTFVLLPQWIQQDLGYPSLHAGLVMAPLGIFAVILSPLLGKILPKTDARIIVTLAFILFGAVFYMRSMYVSTIDISHLIWPTLLQGIPTVMFFIPLTTIILSGLSPDKVPAAAGLSNFVRIFAGAIGTSITNTLWSHRAIVHHADLTEQASSYTFIFTDFLAQLRDIAGLNQEQQYAVFNYMVNNQSNMLGLNDIFRVSAFIFITLIPLVWITKPNKAKFNDLSSAAH